MEEKHFKFKVQLGNFEFEVEGDKAFVEKTMNRYEGRFLPRFQQLVDAAQRAMAAQQANPTAAQEKPHASTRAPAVELPPVEVAPLVPEKKKEGKWDRRDKSRRSRGGRKYPRNNSSTWVKPPPSLPKNQEVIRNTYVPEGDMVGVAAIEANDPEVAVTPYLEEPTGNAKVKTEERPHKADFGKLDEMYRKLNPRTHHEKILVFAYFLNTGNGFSEFTGNDIKECYDAVKADSPGNINQVLNHASRTGFLIKLHGGRQVRYSLTSKGRHFVERGFEPGERNAST